MRGCQRKKSERDGLWPAKGATTEKSVVSKVRPCPVENYTGKLQAPTQLFEQPTWNPDIIHYRWTWSRDAEGRDRDVTNKPKQGPARYKPTLERKGTFTNWPGIQTSPIEKKLEPWLADWLEANSENLGSQVQTKEKNLKAATETSHTKIELIPEPQQNGKVPLQALKVLEYHAGAHLKSQADPTESGHAEG